eukprot:scaffold2136_cov242-Pinguiococcus_pyrenoidosus.AAC.28
MTRARSARFGKARLWSFHRAGQVGRPAILFRSSGPGPHRTAAVSLEVPKRSHRTALRSSQMVRDLGCWRHHPRSPCRPASRAKGTGQGQRKDKAPRTQSIPGRHPHDCCSSRIGRAIAEARGSQLASQSRQNPFRVPFQNRCLAQAPSPRRSSSTCWTSATPSQKIATLLLASRSGDDQPESRRSSPS